MGEGGPLLLVLGTDGLGPGQPLDLYAFDLAARRWHRVDAGGRAPQPESVGAAACAVLADRLLCLWSCRTGARRAYARAMRCIEVTNVACVYV